MNTENATSQDVNREEELLKIINQDAIDDYVHMSERVQSDPKMESPLKNRDDYNSDSEGSEGSYGESDLKLEEDFRNSHPVSPPRPSRRMSMRMPSLNAFHVSIANEHENSAFLEELTLIITELPVPPSHEHTVSTQTTINTAYNNISDLVGISSKTAIKVVSGGWGAVTKFAGKLTTGALSSSRKSSVSESDATTSTSTTS
jgi:hypothetical protein